LRPLISLTIDDPRRIFCPGEVLRCEYQIEAESPADIRAVEASVLWRTSGKGDEDLEVHAFHRRTPADAEEGDLRRLHTFETVLPKSPLSYEGVILKINWCVRVRAFFKNNKDIVSDHRFVLGSGALTPHTGEPASE